MDDSVVRDPRKFDNYAASSAASAPAPMRSIMRAPQNVASYTPLTPIIPPPQTMAPPQYQVAHPSAIARSPLNFDLYQNAANSYQNVAFGAAMRSPDKADSYQISDPFVRIISHASHILYFPCAARAADVRHPQYSLW